MSAVRIANLVASTEFGDFQMDDMARTRFVRMSQSLVRLGYCVDMVVHSPRPAEIWESGLRLVRSRHVEWGDYHVIKTNYHQGLLMLADAGADAHPLGFVGPYRDDEHLADLVEATLAANWDRRAAQQYMIDRHSWDLRARFYDRLIRRELGHGATR